MNAENFWESLKAGESDAVLAQVEANPGLLELRLESGHGPIRLAFECGHEGLAVALAKRVQPDAFEACLLDRLDLIEAYDTDQLRDLRSDDGWSLLHLAAFAGRARVVAWLLDQGTDIGSISANPMANSPLHAALAGRQDVATIKALVAAGADVGAGAAGGVTPLHLAASRGNDVLVDLLAAAGAEPRAMDAGQMPADIAQERGFEVLAARMRQADQ